MAGTVITRDHGWDALRKQAAEWMGLGVVVGIRQEKGAVSDGDTAATVAEYATDNEFGSESRRVPERSFLRSTIDERRDAYTKSLERAVEAGIDAAIAGGDGTAAVERALGLLGMEAAGDVQATIRDLREPPNSPVTIARKGSSNPLIDTGRMRASIDSEVRRAGEGAA